MLKIGLTGGIGCGKTTVSNLFATFNHPKEIVSILDTDVIARRIIEKGKPAYTKIVDVFGTDILNDDASINRAVLRKIIFNDPGLKKQLEDITHPAIHNEVKKAISQLTSKYCIIVIPLLFETNSNYQLDRILVIDCDKDSQIKRTIQRDQVSEDDVNLILKSQVSRKFRLEHADDIILNNDNPEKLMNQVEKLHEFYLNLAKTGK